MKSMSILVSSAVVAVGLLGGTLAYQASSAPVGQDSSVSAAPAPTPAVARHHRKPVVTRWAPCKPPATRVGKVCVTDEVRTVVVPAPAPAPVAQPVRATQPTSREHGDDRDDRGDGDDGDDEHESDDD